MAILYKPTKSTYLQSIKDNKSTYPTSVEVNKIYLSPLCRRQQNLLISNLLKPTKSTYFQFVKAYKIYLSLSVCISLLNLLSQLHIAFSIFKHFPQLYLTLLILYFIEANKIYLSPLGRCQQNLLISNL